MAKKRGRYKTDPDSAGNRKVRVHGILKEPFASLLRQPSDPDALIDAIMKMNKIDLERLHKLADVARKLTAPEKRKGSSRSQDVSHEKREDS